MFKLPVLLAVDSTRPDLFSGAAQRSILIHTLFSASAPGTPTRYLRDGGPQVEAIVKSHGWITGVLLGQISTFTAPWTDAAQPMGCGPFSAIMYTLALLGPVLVNLAALGLDAALCGRLRPLGRRSQGSPKCQGRSRCRSVQLLLPRGHFRARTAPCCLGMSVCRSWGTFQLRRLNERWVSQRRSMAGVAVVNTFTPRRQRSHL